MLVLTYIITKFIHQQFLINLESSFKRITTIPLNFRTILASINGLFMTQLIERQRNLTSLLFFYTDLYGILARNESAMIFLTNRRYLFKCQIIKDKTF